MIRTSLTEAAGKNQPVSTPEYISNLIEYIEQNLPNELDTSILTKLGYVSHTQLYRDFYNITGHPVKEYIRKRRLSNALALIKSSEFSFADIAYQCGYSSQQALCRSVKASLGMTPVEYKHSDTYFFFPPFDEQTIQNVTVTTETIPETLCIRFYQASLKNIENNAVNGFLNLIPEYSGRIFGRNGKQSGSHFCYELYLSDISLTDIDTDIDKDIKSRLGWRFEVGSAAPEFSEMFAVSDVRNDEVLIGSAWDYLYSEWLRSSMFEPSDKNYFEEYIIKNRRILKLRLRIPIKKRENYTNIRLIKNPDMKFIVSKSRGLNAEQTSSKAVISYLSAHYPYIVKSAKEFYLSKGAGTYTCGVRVASELQIEDGSNVANLHICGGLYLSLTNNMAGDYDIYKNTLIRFAEGNGMIPDIYGVFAVYDVNNGYENPKIQVFCPVIPLQNDNRTESESGIM